MPKGNQHVQRGFRNVSYLLWQGLILEGINRIWYEVPRPADNLSQDVILQIREDVDINIRGRANFRFLWSGVVSNFVSNFVGDFK